jgi:hypothetical protein
VGQPSFKATRRRGSSTRSRKSAPPARHDALDRQEQAGGFKGMGAGKALADAALGYARAHHLQVVPTCSFMAAYITRHPEWHDIVHPKFRERLGIA